MMRRTGAAEAGDIKMQNDGKKQCEQFIAEVVAQKSKHSMCSG